MEHMIGKPVFTIITITTTLIIIIITTTTQGISASQTGLSDGKTLYSGEFCLMETFTASCPQPPQQPQPNHPQSTHLDPPTQASMVIMNRAKYGRMREGRCMRKNYDEKGCNTDVLDILDRKCSGQRSCNVTLPDPDLFETKPCPEDLNPYLEASYYCVSVNFLDKDTCLRIGHVLLTSSEGYLTGQSESLYNHHHHNHHHLKLNPHDIGRMTYCSYVIELLPGQRVNLSIINFAREPAPRHQLHDNNNKHNYYHKHQPIPSQQQSGHHHHHHRSRHPQLEQSQPHMVEVCSNVAMVYEELEVKGRNSEPSKTSTTSLSVCTGDEREKLVHVSVGYRIRVEFLNVGGNNFKQTNFLMRYKASGCASSLKQANEDMWFQREGGVMKVGCNSTNEIWYLACKDVKWDGNLGNCTSMPGDATESGWKLKQMLNMEDSLPFGMFLVVAMGVAIGVIIGSLLLCTIAMVTKRHRRLLIKPGHHLTQPQPQQQQQRQILQQPQPRSRLNSSEDHRDTICFYQDQSSIPLQHHQQYYHRCHHGQHQDDMGDCRCCGQRETAALLADSRQGIEDIGGKNPSTPMVIRDAVKATHCQPKETVLEDLEIFDNQKSTHSAYQYHQLMLISGRQKNPGEPVLMKPKQHAGDLIQPHIPCNEHICSLANSNFNYQ